MRIARALSAVALVALIAVVGVIAAPIAGAAAVTLPVTTQPALASILVFADEETEADTGAGTVVALSNDNPTVWLPEDPNPVLGAGEEFVIRMYSARFSYAADDCATYNVQATRRVTTDGPGDPVNHFTILSDADGVFGGDAEEGPAIGESADLSVTSAVSAEALRDGTYYSYGTLTAVRFGAFEMRFGTTYGLPVITLTEDRSACPPPTTATPSTTIPTSPTTAPPSPLSVSDPRPAPGSSVTVSGDGYRPGTQVLVGLFPEGVLLAAPTVDDAGSFSVQVRLSGGVSGLREIRSAGTGIDGEPRTQVLGIYVTGAAPPPAQPAELAATGPNHTSALALVGLMACLAGLGLRRASSAAVKRRTRLA